MLYFVSNISQYQVWDQIVNVQRCTSHCYTFANDAVHVIVMFCYVSPLPIRVINFTLLDNCQHPWYQMHLIKNNCLHIKNGSQEILHLLNNCNLYFGENKAQYIGEWLLPYFFIALIWHTVATLHADFTTINPCTEIHKIIVWPNKHGPLYAGRWQPIVAIKLSKKWETWFFLTSFIWQANV